MRVEQFYPFHADKFREFLKPYSKVKRLVWCQEEPQNMGAWTFLAPIIEEVIGRRPEFVGRSATASPATGSLTLHKREQAELIANALGEPSLQLENNRNLLPMPKEVIIPALGESITSGILSSWKVDEGSYVELDQPIYELETDKITQEGLADASGTIKFLAQEGDEVEIGATIATIDESADSPTGSATDSTKEDKDLKILKLR